MLRGSSHPSCKRRYIIAVSLILGDLKKIRVCPADGDIFVCKASHNSDSILAIASHRDLLPSSMIAGRRFAAHCRSLTTAAIVPWIRRSANNGEGTIPRRREPSVFSLGVRCRTPRHVASTDLEMAYTVKAAQVFDFRTAEVTCARILFSDRVIVAERFHRGSGYFSAGQALFRSRRRGGALWAADIRVRPVF